MISTQKAQIRDILEMIKEDFLLDDYLIYIYYWNSNILLCNIIYKKIFFFLYIIRLKFIILNIILNQLFKIFFILIYFSLKFKNNFFK